MLMTMTLTTLVDAPPPGIPFPLSITLDDSTLGTLFIISQGPGTPPRITKWNPAEARVLGHALIDWAQRTLPIPPV